MREVSPYLLNRPNPGIRESPVQQLDFDETKLNLRDYWLTVRKHRKTIGAVFFCSLLIAFLYIFVATPVYTGVSTLLIERNAPNVLNISQVLTEPPGPDEYDYYKTQYELLRSRRLAAQVIRNQNLANTSLFGGDGRNEGLIAGAWKGMTAWLAAWSQSPAQSETSSDETSSEEGALRVKPGIIDDYLGGLDIAPQRGTRLVRIQFNSADPKIAARIANAHAQAYIRQGLELHSDANEEAQKFLEGKLTELKERVEKSEAALNAYRRDKGIISLTNSGNKIDTTEKEDIVVTRLDELNRELTAAEGERIALEGEEQLIHKHDYDSLPSVINSQLIQQLKQELARLAGDYAKINAEFKRGYPPLDDIGAQVQQVNSRLQREVQIVVAGIESAYLVAVSKERKLREKLEEQKALALSQKDLGVQYAILAREVDTNRQLYDSVLQRMKETGVAADVHASNDFVVDMAEVPLKPSSPQKIVDLLSGGALGLIGGLVLAFVLESLDNTLKNPEDVERFLHLPSLCVVPDFLSDNGRMNAHPYNHRPAINGGVIGGGSAISLNGCSSEVVIVGNRFSAAAESYRVLRAAILLSRAGEPPKATIITSALDGEGKTVTAVNSAIILSQLDARVLLIDADLRRPRCHKLFRVDNRRGLTEVLTGQVECESAIRPTSIDRVFLMSAGALPPNPAELLGSKKMRSTLATLRSQYEYIVIDSTPAMLISDGLPLHAMVDGTILVVNGPKTPRHVVQETCERLRYVGAKVLGVVLNKADTTSPDYYYSHHYYTYNRNSYYHQEPDQPLTES